MLSQVHDSRWQVVEVALLRQGNIESLVMAHCWSVVESDVKASFCQSCH